MYKKKGQLPPGPTPWLFMGNILQKDILPLYKFYPKLVEKYGPIFTIWMGPKPAVVLCGYEVVKDALVDHAEVFGGRSTIPILDRVTKDLGISSNNEAKWREVRRFTLATLKDFGMGKKTMSERVQEEALCLVKDITAAIQGKRACPGEALAQMELFLFFSTLLQNFCFQLDVEVTDMDLFSFYSKHRDKNQNLPIQVIKRLL